MKRAENHLQFSVSEFLNIQQSEDGTRESVKELAGVSAAIDQYDENMVAVYIADTFGEWDELFQGSDSLKEAVSYANEILKNEVDYSF